MAHFSEESIAFRPWRKQRSFGALLCSHRFPFLLGRVWSLGHQPIDVRVSNNYICPEKRRFII